MPECCLAILGDSRRFSTIDKDLEEEGCVVCTVGVDEEYNIVRFAGSESRARPSKMTTTRGYSLYTSSFDYNEAELHKRRSSYIKYRQARRSSLLRPWRITVASSKFTNHRQTGSCIPQLFTLNFVAVPYRPSRALRAPVRSAHISIRALLLSSRQFIFREKTNWHNIRNS